MKINYSFFFIFLFCMWLPLSLQAEQKSAVVTADLAELDQKNGITLLTGNVNVVVKSKNATLKAGKVKLKRDNISKTITEAEIDNDIEIHEQENVFTGDHMFYNKAQAIAELKGNIKLKSKGAFIDAEQILYHLDTQKGKVTAKKGELVKIKVQRKAINKVEAASLEGQSKSILVSRKEGKINLLENVHLKDLLKETNFKTDNATLFFDASDDVEEIIAEGHFLLNQPGRYSVADRAHFDYKSGKITLTGNVIVQDKDRVELRSSEVEMFLDVSKGFISGGKNKPLQLIIPLPN